MAALRQPARQLRLGARTLQTALTASAPFSLSVQRRRGLATAVQAPPVTQNNHGSKGPTAMVFLNMGGPSTTDEVGDFLSRLFVSDTCGPTYGPRGFVGKLATTTNHWHNAPRPTVT